MGCSERKHDPLYLCEQRSARAEQDCSLLCCEGAKDWLVRWGYWNFTDTPWRLPTQTVIFSQQEKEIPETSTPIYNISLVSFCFFFVEIGDLLF